MAGIISYGAYIPIYRLKHELIAQVWGGGAKAGGEKAIANSDEDSLTMAVEAAIDCLTDTARDSVDALFFATTTAPYIEKQSASIIAAACDLRPDIFAVDFTNSIRSGTMALRAAVDAVRSGSAKKALVVAADRRVPPPNSELEPVFGDGAAALLIGEQDVAAELQGSYNLTSEFIDIWRLPEDGQFRVWEDRFIHSEGYTKHLRAAIEPLLKENNLAQKDLAKVAYYAPDQRRHTGMAKALKLDSAQIQNPLFDKVGNTGTALALMTFIGALEEAKPGDKVLLANYGDGADAYVFQVTEELDKIKGNRRGIKKHLDSKMIIDSYGKYIKFRKLMQFQPSFEFKWRSSLTVTWRDRDQIYRFYGQKCRTCGNIQYPKQRLCMYCQTKDNFEVIKLADKKGKLFSYSMDERAPITDPPNVIAAVNFDEGGRLFSNMTDRDVTNIQVGMPVELTFRNMHGALGVQNYFWKCRPVRVI